MKRKKDDVAAEEASDEEASDVTTGEGGSSSSAGVSRGSGMAQGDDKVMASIFASGGTGSSGKGAAFEGKKGKGHSKGKGKGTWGGLATDWAPATNQAAMFDRNFAVAPSRSSNGLKFNLKSGELALCGQGNTDQIQVDPKQAAAAVTKHQKKGFRAVWTDCNFQGKSYSNGKWQFWEGYKSRGAGIGFMVDDGGCEECGGHEMWRIVLEESPSTASSRLAIKYTAHCHCGGDCDDEFESSSYIAHEA